MIRASRLIFVVGAMSFLCSSRLSNCVITSRHCEAWGEIGPKRKGPWKLVSRHVEVWIHRLVIRTESFVIIKNG